METRKEYLKTITIKKKQNKLVKVATLSALTLLTIGGASPALASTWVANTPESIQIMEGQQSYTMILGDTLWAISQRTNLTVQTLANINNINLNLGEQYLLPVGRVISFDGNKVTVKAPTGEVVSETIVTEDQKVNPNQNVGEVVNPSITEPTTPAEGENGVTPEVPGGNGGGAIDPGTPVNPVDPTDPTDPVDPEVPEETIYRGEFIDGVNNGTIGTWTNKDDMMEYISENWAENTANGTWTDNYVASTNVYGWIAEFY